MVTFPPSRGSTIKEKLQFVSGHSPIPVSVGEATANGSRPFEPMIMTAVRKGNSRTRGALDSVRMPVVKCSHRMIVVDVGDAGRSGFGPACVGMPVARIKRGNAGKRMGMNWTASPRSDIESMLVLIVIAAVAALVYITGDGDFHTRSQLLAS